MDWYEPGEDSYTLYDVLNNENITGKIVVDLGCSTGILTDLLDANNFVISIDLNRKALEQLKEKNAIQTDLLKGINQKKIDVIVFNPPYVPDFKCPILGGGVNGRDVIDRFVNEVEIELVYLLIIEANKPLEVVTNLREKGYQVDVLMIRKVIGETIIILKALKKADVN